MNRATGKENCIRVSRGRRSWCKIAEGNWTVEEVRPMSSAGESVAPFRIAWSGRCRQQFQELLEQARAKGRLAEVCQAARDFYERLTWIPLDFGEPTTDYVHLGVVEMLGAAPPFVVTYCVDQPRRLVYVVVPCKLLPNSGL